MQGRYVPAMGSADSTACSEGGGGQGITGVMEETEPKIVGYTRDSKGKVVKRSLRDISNTVTTFTSSGCTTDMYAAEPKIAASRGRGKAGSNNSKSTTAAVQYDYECEQGQPSCRAEDKPRRAIRQQPEQPHNRHGRHIVLHGKRTQGRNAKDCRA